VYETFTCKVLALIEHSVKWQRRTINVRLSAWSTVTAFRLLWEPHTLVYCAVALEKVGGPTRFDNWGPRSLFAKLLSDRKAMNHNTACCHNKGIHPDNINSIFLLSVGFVAFCNQDPPSQGSRSLQRPYLRQWPYLFLQLGWYSN